MNTASGKFITLEGIEGAGKSTVIAEIEQWLHKKNIATLCTREPGGTPVAESIRAIVLSNDYEEALDPIAETLLVFAARQQHLQEVIRPALAAGIWVLCDRFTDATLAYQGAGREVGVDKIRTLADWLHDDLWPDATFLLDVPEDVGLARARGRSAPDRFESESEAFFSRARAAYKSQAAAEPARFHAIDASQTLPQVRAAVRERIEQFWQSACSQP